MVLVRFHNISSALLVHLMGHIWKLGQSMKQESDLPQRILLCPQFAKLPASGHHVVYVLI